MKNFLTIIFYFLIVHTIQAQNPTCSCKTKQGVNAISVEGTVNYKGTSQTIGHTYEVNLTFKNESNCLVSIENILIGTTDIKPTIPIAINVKNQKKNFKKTLQLKTLLEPSIGLDDALFADLLISYKVYKQECSDDVTVAYKDISKKK